MKINKVKLHNFSSYEGNNEFDFEITDAGKNIVLIGGKNGAGKTSLFTAIKVALYGPLAYGYVGVNSHYISKIKDLINSKAFQQEVVESEVQLTLQLKIERDIRNYVITRKWDYTNQKLTEEYTVARDGKLLNDQELSYFENYLRSIIPPDLFEFFLFDGEEVGNIFSTSAYNTYVRNAVFTMCGMDVFEIIGALKRQGKTVIIAEHKVDLLAEYCDEIIAMAEGTIIAQGTVREVFQLQILREKKVRIPQVVTLALLLEEKKKALSSIPVNEREAVAMLKERGDI